MALRNRLLFWAVIAIIVLALAVWAFSPRAIDVDIVKASSRSMTVSVNEEGKTRIHDVFEISAPVSGQLERISLEAGDCVYQGETIVAGIRPVAAPVLDSRSQKQLSAVADAAAAAVTASKAELDRVRSELNHATTDANRYRLLAPGGAISRQMLERAEAEETTLQAAARAAEAALAMRRQELAAARAALRPSSEDEGGELIDVIAPIDGVLLRRLRQSEGPVAQGAPLVEVGDPEEIEIVADLLSEDAVRISPGDPVIISDWGGPVLQGKVRQIEPFAFTKISALGIEEQRVNVVVDLLQGQPADRLGHGYRVDVAVQIWSQDNVLTIPITALFKQDRNWSVYRIENGRARLRQVTIGHLNGQEAEILLGLEEGDLLVEHPSSRIVDKVLVRAREAPQPTSEAQDGSEPAAVQLSATWDNTVGGCDFLIR
ncbi:efflux RND transporter periplasmic adaptor subunit [uncultured Hyphomonas sp.]|uniref:efflux RND transporter periplasmic adaptor subunit n=1 Tax=uncultured Hyphomonas sp. TaxID=225298 RepID=UPI00261BF422|nr:efflux RND transporter periplasmic adaptor subunit [uncultured Hyphomonas sp.]